MKRWLTGPAGGKGFSLAAPASDRTPFAFTGRVSKGGWLLMLLLALLGMLRLPFSRRLKILAGAAVLLMGVAGFAIQIPDFFEKGATV
jgi:hypothetical protein